MGDQHGFFQNIKSVQLEEAKEFESHYVRDEEGSLLREKGHICGRWVRFSRSPLNAIRHAQSRHSEKATAATRRECNPNRAHGGGSCHCDEGNGKHGSSGTGRPSRGTAETRTSIRPDHPAGAPPTYHPHLARGESPTAVERRGHYRTPQEGRQDGVRKLPRYLVRVTRG